MTYRAYMLWRRVVLAFAVLLLAVSVLLGMPAENFWLLRAQGKTTTGVVTARGADHAVVTFRVDETDYSIPVSERSYVPGEVVPVLFLSSDPRVAEVGRPSDALLWLGGALLLTVLGLLRVFRRRPSLIRGAQQRTNPSTASPLPDVLRPRMPLLGLALIPLLIGVSVWLDVQALQCGSRWYTWIGLNHIWACIGLYGIFYGLRNATTTIEEFGISQRFLWRFVFIPWEKVERVEGDPQNLVTIASAEETIVVSPSSFTNPDVVLDTISRRTPERVWRRDTPRESVPNFGP